MKTKASIASAKESATGRMMLNAERRTLNCVCFAARSWIQLIRPPRSSTKSIKPKGKLGYSLILN